jgi:Tol biopolymer transport system component
MQDAALSPDGRRIALALGTEAQSPAVSLIEVETGERRTLSGMAATAVSWMPDGSELLMAAPAPDGLRRWIWRLPVGGGLPRPVLKGEAHWGFPAASPDGGAIAAVRRSASGSELVLHDLERGRGRTLAANRTILSPRFSPDGRQVAWSGSWRPGEVGSGGIWVCPVEEGSTPRRLTSEGAWPVWEPGGEHLLFARFLENRGIWRVPLTGGPPSLALPLDGELEELYLQDLSSGRAGGPLLMLLYEYTGALYALEPPRR